MKAFVTGIGGFAGSYLAEALLAEGWRVSGTMAPGESQANIAHIAERLDLHAIDIGDADAVLRAIDRAAPDCLWHLAAMSFVPDSLTDPLRTVDVNVGGTLNVFEAVRTRRPSVRVVTVTSGDAYGAVSEEQLPITETFPWRPANPYAATKAAADVLAETYVQQYDLAIVRARPFNHTGPRQSPRFVCADFARQIARIEAQRQDPVIRVGRLTAKRDFTDVRDIVQAYLALASPTVPIAAYNICSGRAVAIREILEQLLRLSTAEVRVEEEAGRMRSVEIPEHRGCADLLLAATGWEPRIALEQTLADVLDYWRGRVTQEASS